MRFATVFVYSTPDIYLHHEGTCSLSGEGGGVVEVLSPYLLPGLVLVSSTVSLVSVLETRPGVYNLSVQVLTSVSSLRIVDSSWGVQFVSLSPHQSL